VAAVDTVVGATAASAVVVAAAASAVAAASAAAVAVADFAASAAIAPPAVEDLQASPGSLGSAGAANGTVQRSRSTAAQGPRHVELESVIYVVCGRSRMRRGTNQEFTAETGPAGSSSCRHSACDEDRNRILNGSSSPWASPRSG
jgi:hypothetical protein